MADYKERQRIASRERQRKRRSDPVQRALINENAKLSFRAIRREVIEHYGGKCQCCGEDTYEFLVFDHIHDDGAQHRKDTNISGGAILARWLKRNGFPEDIVQVLCANCNMAKEFNECCPHQNAQGS